MDFAFSTNSLITVISLIAPGYIALRVYDTLYAKKPKDFSRLALESVAYGIILSSIYNAGRHLIGVPTISETSPLSIRYYLPLLGFALIAGLLICKLRTVKPVHQALSGLGFPGPDEDFLRVQFKKLPPNALVTVALRSGQIFSGTPEALSAYESGDAQKLYFNNVAWFAKHRRSNIWDTRPGSLIISAEDILYIETDSPLKRSA